MAASYRAAPHRRRPTPPTDGRIDAATQAELSEYVERIGRRSAEALRLLTTPTRPVIHRAQTLPLRYPQPASAAQSDTDAGLETDIDLSWPPSSTEEDDAAMRARRRSTPRTIAIALPPSSEDEDSPPVASSSAPISIPRAVAGPSRIPQSSPTTVVAQSLTLPSRRRRGYRRSVPMSASSSSTRRGGSGGTEADDAFLALLDGVRMIDAFAGTFSTSAPAVMGGSSGVADSSVMTVRAPVTRVVDSDPSSPSISMADLPTSMQTSSGEAVPLPAPPASPPRVPEEKRTDWLGWLSRPVVVPLWLGLGLAGVMVGVGVAVFQFYRS